MIIEFKSENVWFTADNHFNHGPPYTRNSIIDYCGRPFEDAHHMNKTMIDNWNKVVGDKDLVFHLGDFGFGKYPQIEPIRRELSGTIILLKGNHDRSSVAKLKEAGFHQVYKSSIEIKIGDTRFLVSHVPEKNLEKGVVNLCGHVHENWLVKNFSINVGVDVHGFKPVSLEEINMMIPDLKRGIII